MHAGDPSAGEAGFPHQFNHIHSVFAWQQKQRAFAVMTDNMEFEDIDIMEITDPTNPVLIAEVDANEFGVAREGVVSHGNFQGSFLHDMVVKKIGRTWTLLVSYWDGGWVKLNVNDPANPEYISDFDYPLPDTLFPEFEFPEGNAHQAEFTRNNRWIIGTDEDFSPFRLLNDEFEVTSGPAAGAYPAVSSASRFRSRATRTGRSTGRPSTAAMAADVSPGGPTTRPRSTFLFPRLEPSGRSGRGEGPHSPAWPVLLLGEDRDRAECGLQRRAHRQPPCRCGEWSGARRHPVRKPGP